MKVAFITVYHYLRTKCYPTSRKEKKREKKRRRKKKKKRRKKLGMGLALSTLLLLRKPK
jgi:hypothetical protein